MVMITDSNTCGIILTDTIINLAPAITYNFTTQAPQCLNNITGTILATVSGGVIPYQYNWSTGDTINSIEIIRGREQNRITITKCCITHCLNIKHGAIR